MDTRIYRPPAGEGGAKTEVKNHQMGGQTMTEYRIAEHNRRFYIEYLDDKFWRINDEKNVPKFFDSLADARSWVATIKRGVVYHDAEEAPNLAQDERKAEDDTSDGIKPLEWFEERHMQKIVNTTYGYDFLNNDPRIPHDLQLTKGYRYSDPQ
jgi:hypothetical protein